MAKAFLAWPPVDIQPLKNSLDGLSEALDSTKDPTILNWLSRMMVIRSCGYLEQTAQSVFTGYIEHKSGGMVRAFSQSWLEKSRNPSPESLSGMIGRFDSNLQLEFCNFLDADDERLRRELAFLVNRRNLIAHGLNEGVNKQKALDLKQVAEDVSDWLILSFNPLPKLLAQ